MYYSIFIIVELLKLLNSWTTFYFQRSCFSSSVRLKTKFEFCSPILRGDTSITIWEISRPNFLPLPPSSGPKINFASIFLKFTQVAKIWVQWSYKLMLSYHASYNWKFAVFHLSPLHLEDDKFSFFPSKWTVRMDFRCSIIFRFSDHLSLYLPNFRNLRLFDLFSNSRLTSF